MSKNLTLPTLGEGIESATVVEIFVKAGDTIAEEQAIMARLLAGERIEHFETVRLRRDGRAIAVSLTISPVKDDAGRIVAASKIARDISTRLEAAAREQALLAEPAATNAKFRALFEQATLFAGILDLQGTIVEANKPSWEGCGYNYKEKFYGSQTEYTCRQAGSVSRNLRIRFDRKDRTAASARISDPA